MLHSLPVQIKKKTLRGVTKWIQVFDLKRRLLAPKATVKGTSEKQLTNFGSN